MAYPATFSNVAGTTLVSAPPHSSMHNAMETTVGTTAGTNVLKNFAAGDFPARINASNVLSQRISGTVDNAVLGTPAITAGSIINAQLIGTSQFTGGSVSNAVIGTPAITGGTANSITLGTPTLQGLVVNTGNIVDAAVTSRKVQLQYAGTSLTGSNFSTVSSGATWYDVTGFAATISPATNSVMEVSTYFQIFSSGNGGRVDARLLYNGTALNSALTVNGSNGERYPSSLVYIGTIPSGTGTVSFQISDAGGGNQTITFTGSGYNQMNVKWWSV